MLSPSKMSGHLHNSMVCLAKRHASSTKHYRTDLKPLKLVQRLTLDFGSGPKIYAIRKKKKKGKAEYKSITLLGFSALKECGYLLAV